MIHVEHLTRRYGSFLAVDDLTFHMEAGRIYGFLGPNGAGKSTTMNILTGYLSAAEGSVIVNGYDVFEEPEEAKRQIGYLPEQPPLYGDMTVREYLQFVFKLKKAAMNEDAMEVLLAEAGLTEVAGRLIRTLSKGYRQRVGIAQALVGDPPVIILDEPTEGLDPLQRVEVRDLIRRLGGGHTVILSTHILSEVAEVADVVLILSHGRLVAQDSPQNLARHAAGTSQYHLVVKGREEALRAALQSLPLTVLQMEARPGGLCAVQLESPEGRDVREELFYALAGARCPIMEESVSALSLEDVFIELTAADQDPVSDPAEQEG